MTIREITDEIGALYERMKAAVASATEKGEPMGKEEEEQYAKNNSRLADLIKLRDQHYALLDAQTKATNTRGLAIQQMAEERSLTPKQERRLGKFLDGEEYRSAFLSYLTKGQTGLTGDEYRAMSEGTNADGGFLPATEFYNQLIKKRFLTNGMRQVANVMPLGTFKTDIVLESTFATASYESEAAAKNESSGQFSNVVLQPHTMRVFSKISNELLADAPSRGPGFSIESILADQFGRVMGEKEEEAFVSGTGSGQPSGILSYITGFSGGAITKVTTAATNVIVAQDLLNVVYSLPRQYRQHPSCAILVSDKLLSYIRAMPVIASSTTTYYWQPSGILGEPDRFMGIPIYASHYVPDPATTSQGYTSGGICGLIGAFDYLVIGQRSQFSLRVLNERYADEDNIGMVCTSRVDIKYTQTDAFRFLRSSAT